jgi:hypothetical protein
MGDTRLGSRRSVRVSVTFHQGHGVMLHVCIYVFDLICGNALLKLEIVGRSGAGPGAR